MGGLLILLMRASWTVCFLVWLELFPWFGSPYFLGVNFVQYAWSVVTEDNNGPS